MSQMPEDDRELDAFLARESPLQRQWRDLPTEEPADPVDAAVRAAARRAVHAGPRTVGGLQVSRWRFPLAIAATLVIGSSLTLMVAQHEPPLRADRDAPAITEKLQSQPAPATTPAPASVPASAPGNLAAAVRSSEEPATPDTALAQPSAEPATSTYAQRDAAKLKAPSKAPAPAETGAATARDAPKAESDSSPAQRKAEETASMRTRSDTAQAPLAGQTEADEAAPANAADESEAAATPVAPTPPPPAPPSADARNRNEAAPSASVATSAAPAAGAVARTAPRRAEQPAAPAAPAASADAASAPTTLEKKSLEELDAEPLRLRTRPLELADSQAPAPWIEHIRALRRAGKFADADRELRALQLRHPDYKLPDDLKPTHAPTAPANPLGRE